MKSKGLDYCIFRKEIPNERFSLVKFALCYWERDSVIKTDIISPMETKLDLGATRKIYL